MYISLDRKKNKTTPNLDFDTYKNWSKIDQGLFTSEDTIPWHAEVRELDLYTWIIKLLADLGHPVHKSAFHFMRIKLNHSSLTKTG